MVVTIAVAILCSLVSLLAALAGQVQRMIILSLAGGWKMESILDHFESKSSPC